MTRLPQLFAAAALLAAPLAAPLHAQDSQELPRPRPSQHGTVSQEVALTTITIGYDRPVARGRALYGNIIEWDVISTPGANRATWIELSTPVTFAGAALEAGRYGLWHIPHESEPWELVIVSEWDAHHSFFPFESEVARVRVAPASGAHMETLAFYFPVVGEYEATLRVHWGTTVLPLRIEVPR